MTFDQIKKTVGKNIKYYTAAGGWLTGRDVTEDDIGDMINDLYRGELFQYITTQYPAYYRQVSKADNWLVSGTVDATTATNILVATTSIFTNGMVGLWVYNTATDAKEKITGYTSGTTVTLENDIDDTWDGDAIQVLGQEFAISGDATDLYVIEQVGIKYDENRQDYINTQNLRPKFDMLQRGDEIYSEGRPQVYSTTINVGGTPTTGFGVLPQFSVPLADSIELTYIAKPVALSADGDVPRIPDDLALLYGATAWAFRQRQLFTEAGRWEELYQQKKKQMLANYRPESTGSPRIPRIPRRYAAMWGRRI